MDFYNLLIGNWRDSIQAPSLQIIIALAAVACGAMIGSERQRHEKPAGLRTLILVCLGSASFTMASFIFESKSGDSGRVAAQIVTGIGFLGAGVIMHGRSPSISGATTAAVIWTTAAIGMIDGAGYVGGAFGVTLLARVVLSGIRLFETHIACERAATAVEIAYECRSGLTRVRIERILVDYHVEAKEVSRTCGPDGQEIEAVHLQLHLRRIHLRYMLGDIADIPGVLGISERPLTESRPHSK